MTGSPMELQKTKRLGSKPQYAYTHDWLNNTGAHLLKRVVITCNIGLIGIGETLLVL